MGDTNESYPTVALLPWLRLTDNAKLGKVEFISWKSRSKKSKISLIEQATIRKIMSSYKDINGKRVDEAAIAYHADQDINGNMTVESMSEIYEAANALAFIAISQNEYFKHGASYFNSSYFQVYFQRFSADNDYLTITSRRRDGETLDGGHRHGEVKITVPPQCNFTQTFSPNDALLKALSTVLERKESIHRRLIRSISLFALANTDSGILPLNQELILTMMAVEGLFKSCQGKLDLARKVSKLVAKYGEVKVKNSKYRISRTVGEIIKDDTNCMERCLHFVWLWECYRLRNDYVHGNELSKRSWCWSQEEHTFFASWLFPLLIKILLKEDGILSLNIRDEAMLSSVDQLLNEREWNNRISPKSIKYRWAATIDDKERELDRNRRKIAFVKAISKKN